MRLGKHPKKSRSAVPAGNGGKPQHISRVTVIGQVNLDLVKTVYEPLIKEVAASSMEEYAVRLAEYQDAVQASDDDERLAEIQSDGSSAVNRPSEEPAEPLFSSTQVLNDFLESLYETSDHFFPPNGSGGFKVYANAAKFERMLDEKYGVFRPFITNHPQVERAIRSLQRQYAMGQWSPIRSSPPPIPRSTAIIILFMMQRGGIQWQVLLLTSLLLIVGLQPWALVSLVALGHALIRRRKNRAIGNMSDNIPQVDAYYHDLQTEPVAASGMADTDPKELAERAKHQALLQPVGKPLAANQAIDTTPYDTIILGHGPGTLFTGSLLSRAGRKVLVLSPRMDASGCLELEQCNSPKFKSIPFDVEANNVSKISKMQPLLAPALSTKTDYQGGIRFAQIGTEDDGFAFEVLSVPGMGTDRPTQSIPFVLKASGAPSLMNDAASLLGDGWPDFDGSIGNSTVGAYLAACEVINASASGYYVSKIIPENVNTLRSDSQFYESAIRHTAPFLNKCFPVNAHTRSLMAAIGMRGENIKPSATSMAAHVSNICSVNSGEGMHYPIGGPRALCKALANVIEKSGGQVLTGVTVREFVFDQEARTQESSQTITNSDKDPLPPRCLGVRLHDGRVIEFDKERYGNNTSNSPAIISCVGLIVTFIRLLDEETRTKYKVPRGLPALSERRPVFKVLFLLRGSAEELDITGADFYRLPSASIPRDRVDESGEVLFGEVGGANEATEESLHEVVTEGTINEEPTTDVVADHGARKKGLRTKYHAGESWVHIAFPSAKDPTFAARHGSVTTCVVTIEADDDFITAFDTKPRLFLMNKDTASTPADLRRLLDRVTRDLVDLYPQLDGKVEHAEVRGPFQRGLSHNPERYAAKGVRPETPYPHLFVGGSDLTVGDSFAGEAVAGWLVANQVVGYSAADHLLLQKNLTTDLEQFLEPPSLPEYEDVAVPFQPKQGASDVEATP